MQFWIERGESHCTHSRPSPPGGSRLIVPANVATAGGADGSNVWLDIGQRHGMKCVCVCVWRRQQPVWKYCPEMCLEKLRKTTQTTGWSVCRLRFEPVNSRIHVRSFSDWAALFYVFNVNTGTNHNDNFTVIREFEKCIVVSVGVFLASAFTNNEKQYRSNRNCLLVCLKITEAKQIKISTFLIYQTNLNKSWATKRLFCWRVNKFVRRRCLLHVLQGESLFKTALLRFFLC